jgi:hypothetical protein
MQPKPQSSAALPAANGPGKKQAALFVRRPGIDRGIRHRLKYCDFWRTTNDPEPSERRTAWVFVHR